MSEELAVREAIPDYLPIPSGTSHRQFRLAKAVLAPGGDQKTRTELMLEAGYAETTAGANASKILDSVGFKRATQAIQQSQADKARGLAAIGRAALGTVEADLKELDPRDRIAAGFKAWELASALGENVHTEGNASAWKSRLRRAMLFYGRLTTLRLLSPQPMQEAAENRHRLRVLARGY